MNKTDQKIADRDTLLAVLVGGDRYAVAALARKDDLGLLRRIAKAGITDATALAVERAWMRGCSRLHIARALGVTCTEINKYVRDIYTTQNA